MKYRKKFECVLCGHVRWVYNKPVSDCFCNAKFPSKYMRWRFRVLVFFVWLIQRIQLRFKGKKWIRHYCWDIKQRKNKIE